jgi:hypothetical protein
LRLFKQVTILITAASRLGILPQKGIKQPETGHASRFFI